MASIEVDSATAEQLKVRATACGLTVAEYLKAMVSTPTSEAEPRLSMPELDLLLESLAFDGPTLPADFSRADIYDGHD